MYYILCFLIAFISSLILTPIMRLIARNLKIYDVPHSNIKTHKEPVPYLGGVALILGFYIALTVIRLMTHFPSGTLYSLRGIIFGSIIIIIIGLIDDIKHKGLGFKTKFLIQAIAGVILIIYGIQIKFINPKWFGIIISLIWIIGITNSVNIIDIMDGLSSGVVFIATLGFFFIGLPGEEIYVNFASIALAGACLGFIPYNLSKDFRIFMGDTGSLFLGFLLAALSLGSKYTNANNLGMFVPLLLLAIPMYDTFLVIYFRWKKGISPFKGSRDHFALRLEINGYSRKKILLHTYVVGISLAVIGFFITESNIYIAASLYILVLSYAFILAYKLSRIKVD